MVAANQIERLLRESLNVKITNVPELEHLVIIVLDYSPTDSERPISMAFGLEEEAKCWLTLTESEIRTVDDEGPSSHPNYRQFAYQGRQFYPYSIRPLGQEVFACVSRFESICRRMYGHAVWS